MLPAAHGRARTAFVALGSYHAVANRAAKVIRLPSLGQASMTHRAACATGPLLH